MGMPRITAAQSLSDLREQLVYSARNPVFCNGWERGGGPANFTDAESQKVSASNQHIEAKTNVVCPTHFIPHDHVLLGNCIFSSFGDPLRSS